MKLLTLLLILLICNSNRCIFAIRYLQPPPPLSSQQLNKDSQTTLLPSWKNHFIQNITTSSTTTTSTPSPISTISHFFNRFIEQSIAKTFEKRYRNCPSLRNALRNGKVKQSSYPNRVARFSCNKGFDLIGNRYSTCIRNHWTHDLPICVSTYCPIKLNVQSPVTLRKISTHNSVVDLTCDLGYRFQINKKNTGKFFIDSTSSSTYLTSSIRAYCIAKQWLIDDWDQPDHSYSSKMIPLDRSPTCEVYEKPTERSMNCTFENSYESLCGWMQDKDDDFDWTRNFLTTLSHYDNTGPSFDHTYGENKTGYYLYLESSYPQSPNDVARLYSPVFQHVDNASVACFQFYYHMYGKAIGMLRLFIKEKYQRLSDLSPVWEISGDQGDEWLAGQIEIQPSTTGTTSGTNLQPFQIIIEGILGNGHQGDIAIDDLLLTLGKSCAMLNNNSSVVDVITEPSITDIDSNFKWLGTAATDDEDDIDVEMDNDTSTIINNNSQTLLLPHHNNEIVRSIVHLKPSIFTTMSTTTTSSTTTTPSTTITTTTPSTTTSTTPPPSTSPSTTTTTTPPTSTTTTPKTPSTIITTTTTLPGTIINSTEFSISNESSSLLNEKLQANNEIIYKNHYSMHWSFILLTIIALLLIIAAILYVGYQKFSIKSSSTSNYDIAAIFINRCKLFRSSTSPMSSSTKRKMDDSELLMVNDDNDDYQQQERHQQHSINDDHCVYFNN